jgi:hypothetical protein
MRFCETRNRVNKVAAKFSLGDIAEDSFVFLVVAEKAPSPAGGG